MKEVFDMYPMDKKTFLKWVVLEMQTLAFLFIVTLMILLLIGLVFFVLELIIPGFGQSMITPDATPPPQWLSDLTRAVEQAPEWILLPLLYLRRAYKWTQAQIAARLGISESCYKNIEEEKAIPRLAQIHALCNLYKRLPNELGLGPAHDYRLGNRPRPPTVRKVVVEKLQRVRHKK
jgi:DNA-binding XRE family transcriptional regulator